MIWSITSIYIASMAFGQYIRHDKGGGITTQKLFIQLVWCTLPHSLIQIYRFELWAQDHIHLDKMNCSWHICYLLSSQWIFTDQVCLYSCFSLWQVLFLCQSHPITTVCISYSNIRPPLIIKWLVTDHVYLCCCFSLYVLAIQILGSL